MCRPVGAIPGSMMSSTRSWVKLMCSSSTTRSSPFVREIGSTLVSSGHWPMK
jgi:hypothetical protein